MSFSRIHVDFYYDIVSPYSYFAFEILHRYQQIWNLDIQLKPFFLGGIMQASGNKPPATVPAKGAYMDMDITRLSKHYAIPTTPPPDFISFMTQTLQPMRLLCATYIHAKQYLTPLTRTMWKRCWGSGADIITRDGMITSLREAGITDTKLQETLMNAINSDAVKALLKKHTSDALELNCFGAPYLVFHLPAQGSSEAHKEIFFGSDRFPVIAEILGKPWYGPVPQQQQKQVQSKL